MTVDEANAAIPRVRALVERVRELVAQARQQAGGAAGRARGNGHGPGAAAAAIEAAVAELDRDGVVLRDLDSGLVDFPASTADGRAYWLCWLVDEPEVAWWHWPEDGFAGRRPLRDAPG